MGHGIEKNECVSKVRNVHSSANILTSAWLELVASSAFAATAMEIFDSSGSVLKFSTGASGAEDASELNYYVFPGGNPALIPINFPKGSRLAVRAVDTSATDGQLLLNFFN